MSVSNEVILTLEVLFVGKGSGLTDWWGKDVWGKGEYDDSHSGGDLYNRPDALQHLSYPEDQDCKTVSKVSCRNTL